MHAFAKQDTENLGMIVKRVSVPIGLEELMEGLTKEVLLKKPKDLYIFASEYFSRLVNMRDQSTHCKTYPIRSVQSITHLKAPDIVQGKKITTTTRPTRHLSRQMSIRSKSPAASKNIQTDSKGNIARRSRDRKESVDSKEPSKPVVKRERSTSTTKKDSSTSRSVSSVQSTPREKRQNSNSRFKSTEDSNKNEMKQPKTGKSKSESKSNVSGSELKNQTKEIAHELNSMKKLKENTKKNSQDILDSDIWAATTNVKQVSKLINEENIRKREEEIKKPDRSENLDVSLSKSIIVDTEMEDSGCDNRSSISNNDASSEKSELLKETGDVEEKTKKTEEEMQETINKKDSIMGSTNDSEVEDTKKELINISEAKEVSARESVAMNEDVKSITDTIEKVSTDSDQHVKKNNIKEVTNKILEEVEAHTNDAKEIDKLTESRVDDTHTTESDENNKPNGDGIKVEVNKISLDAEEEVAKEDHKVKEANRVDNENKLHSSVTEIEENAKTEAEHKNTELNKNILDTEEEKKVANRDYSKNNVVATEDDPNNVDVEAQIKDDLKLNKQDEKPVYNKKERKDSEVIKELEGKEANGDKFTNKKQQSEDYSNKKSVEESSPDNLKEKVANSESERRLDTKAIKQLEIKAVADLNSGSGSMASEDNSLKSEKSIEEDKTKDASPKEKVENVLNIQMKSIDDSNDVLIVSISPRKTGESSSKKSEDTEFAKVIAIPKEDSIEKTNFFRENEEMGPKENNKVTSDNNLNIEINSETSAGTEAKKIELEADKNAASPEVTKEAGKDSENEGILSKSNPENMEKIASKEDIVSSRHQPEKPKNTDSLEKVNKEVKDSFLGPSIGDQPSHKSYLTKENTLAFNSVKDLLDFDNTLINKIAKENDSSEELNELKLIIVENESMDDNIPSGEPSNNIRNKRSATGDEIEEIGLDENSGNSKEEHKDDKVTKPSTEEKQEVQPKTLDSQDTDISLDHDLISTDTSDKGSVNDQNKVLETEEGGASGSGINESERNKKSVSKSQEENKQFEKDALKSENAGQHIIKEADSKSVTNENDKVKDEESLKIEEDTVGKTEENTFIKEEADNQEVKKAPKIGDIEQVATVIEVIKNIFNSKSTEETHINEVRDYLNSFLQNEQTNVFQSGKSQQSTIELFKNDNNKKKKSMLPKSKHERPLSQTNLLNNQKTDPDAKFRRARSVGLIKTPETESRSKIPTSARRSASRRPLVRQLEADSKELEEKLKSTSKDSRDESLKNINGLAKDDVLIAKTILKGVEGAEKHIELIEEHLNYLENGEVKHDSKKLKEQIEAASKENKLKKNLEKRLSTTNADKELSKDLSLDRLSDAALVIQRIWKGFQVRKILREGRRKLLRADNELENIDKKVNTKVNVEEDNAKSKIGDLGDSKNGDLSVNKKEEAAAIKIQSAWKGSVVRKMLRNKEVKNSASQDERAIITIQAIVRGFLQRIKYEKLKTKYVLTKEIGAGTEKNLGNNDEELENAGVGIGATTTHQNINEHIDKDKNLMGEEKDKENKTLAVGSSNEKQDDIRALNKTEEETSEHKLESGPSKERHSKEEESKLVKNSIGSLQDGKDSLKSKEESNNLESKRNISNQKSSALLNSQTASQDLLHSSEFHAIAFLPRGGKSLDASHPEESKSVILSQTGNLKHSSEFHDIVITPLPSNESDVSILEASKMISPGISQDQYSNINSEKVQKEDQKKVLHSIDAKDETIKLKDDVATDEIEKDQKENLNSAHTKDPNGNLKGEGSDVDGLNGVKTESKVAEADKASLNVKTSGENPSVKEDDIATTETKVFEADITPVAKLEDKYDESKDVYIKGKNKIIQENKVDYKLDDKVPINESVLVKVAEPEKVNSSKAISQLEAISNEDVAKIEESKSTVKDKLANIEENAVANKDNSEESSVNAEIKVDKLEKAVDNINAIDASEESKISTEDKVGKPEEVVVDINSDDAIEKTTSGKSIETSSTVDNSGKIAETSKGNKDAETDRTCFEGEEKIVESTNISSKESKVDEADKSSMSNLDEKATIDPVASNIIEDNLSATEGNKDIKTNSNKKENNVENSVGKNVDDTNKASKEKIVEDLQIIDKNEVVKMNIKHLGSKEKVIETKIEENLKTTNDKAGEELLKDIMASDKTEETINKNSIEEKELEPTSVENKLDSKPLLNLNKKGSLDIGPCETRTKDNKEINCTETSNSKETNNSVDQGNKIMDKPDFYRSDTVVEPEIIKKTVSLLHESSNDLEATQQDDKDDNNNTSKEETDLEKEVKSAVKKIVSTTPLETEITAAVQNIIDTPPQDSLTEKPKKVSKFDSMMSVDTVLRHLPEVPTEEIPKTIVQKSMMENAKQNTSENAKQINDSNENDKKKDIHSQMSENKTFDNDVSSASLEMPTDEVSSMGSMDSIVTVTLKPKLESNEVKKPAKRLTNKALSTSAIEDHVVLLDQVQNSLLDQLSGKPVDTKSKFDIDQLRKELHDASTMYTSEDHAADNDHEVMEYLYDFEPEDEAYDSRMVRTPLRELPDIAEETESKEEDGFCGTSNVNNDAKLENEHAEIIKLPKSHEIIIDNDSIKINKNDQKLLHTSEMHDSVLIPTPYEFLHPPQTENDNLKHTSEFHDTLVLPLPSGSDVTITNASKNLLPREASSPASLEEHGNETSPQVPPAGASKTVTPPSRRRATQNRSDDVADAHAPLEDTSSARPEPGGSSLFTHQSPRTAYQNMESERNNNNNKRNNAIVPAAEKNMESQAATKIQAGFRGYQVRKQLKAKTAATDQKRLLRKRSSRENMKETNLEEKSAVKIQAGVRGFLVRRRQKKQVSGSASA